MQAQGGSVRLEERRPRASFVWPRPRRAATGDRRKPSQRPSARDEPAPRPTDLLRLREAIKPYPAEPSDEQLAEELGLPPEQVVRFDMNTLGGGPLPAVVEVFSYYDPAAWSSTATRPTSPAGRYPGRHRPRGHRVIPGLAPMS